MTASTLFTAFVYLLALAGAAVLLTVLGLFGLVAWIAAGSPDVNGDPERDADPSALSPSKGCPRPRSPISNLPSPKL